MKINQILMNEYASNECVLSNKYMNGMIEENWHSPC